MRKLTPHLWFDREAHEAAELYTATFPDSRITDVTTIRDTPSGDTDVVSFELWGHPFMAISAGPLFRFNPSVSFLVSCSTADEVDELWHALSDGGKVLMELDSYPFSPHYGWTEDRYGLSWQLTQVAEGEIAQRITPMLMFVGDVCGKAGEAIALYTSLFPDSQIDDVDRWEGGEGPDVEGTIKFARFRLAGQQLAAMDSAYPHEFAFNEAVSLLINCDTQEEIDHYWQALSAVPEAEQCGWVKDRYGLSWQVAPARMDEMLRTGSPAQLERVTKAFLSMKKFDLAELERAYAGAG